MSQHTPDACEINFQDPSAMESENSAGLDHAMLDENQNLNQGHEIFTTVSCMHDALMHAF